MKFKFGDIVYVHYGGVFKKAVVIKSTEAFKEFGIKFPDTYTLALYDGGAVPLKGFEEYEIIGEKEYENKIINMGN